MADEQEVTLFCELSTAARKLKCSQKSWSEAKDMLEKLKIWAKVKDNRCRLSDASVLQTKGIIMICKDLLTVHTTGKDEQSFVRLMEAMAEAFRFLRNCCAESANNQNSVVSSGVVELIKNIISTLLKPQFQENETRADSVCAVIKCALQLLGNTVVRNEATQRFMWNECFPQLFLGVFSSAGHSIQDYACMVIYNCLNTHSRLQLVSNHDGLKIITHIIHLCSDTSQLEWGYFILDYLICNGLLPEMYQGIEFDPVARIVLLDLFQVKLTDAMDKPTDKANELILTEDACSVSLGYVSEQFENHAVDITLKLQQLTHSDDNFFQVLTVTRLLRVLSTATGLDEDITGLQRRLSLLETCLGLLSETAKPEVQAVFSNVNSVPRGVDSGDLSPSHGFQRDLVRVIGNMCYRHTANQNKVRELEGIPLLLNHCNVDDHNPYICQWAIFAMRNVLENNAENQNVLSSLDRQGLADTSRLRQFGVEAVELDNGRIKLAPLTRPKQP